jgi:hypothetical protein
MATSHALKHSFDDPEAAIRSLNRERNTRLALAVAALVAIVVGIAVGVSAAYSDAPEVRPGLQSR